MEVRIGSFKNKELALQVKNKLSQFRGRPLDSIYQIVFVCFIQNFNNKLAPDINGV